MVSGFPMFVIRVWYLFFLQTFSGRKKPQWKWENSSAELKKKEQIWNISWSKKSTDPKCRPILKVSWSWKLANRRNQPIRGSADKDACDVLHLRTGLREPEYRNTHSQLPKEMGPGAGTSFFCLLTKGVGRGPTLAWPGWKQPDIPVEVDTDRLETSCSEAGV
jgi:hypothetical protein